MLQLLTECTQYGAVLGLEWNNFDRNKDGSVVPVQERETVKQTRVWDAKWTLCGSVLKCKDSSSSLSYPLNTHSAELLHSGAALASHSKMTDVL